MKALDVLTALQAEHGNDVLARLLGAAFRREQLEFRQELIAEGEQDPDVLATDRQTFVVDQLEEFGREWLAGFADYEPFTDSALNND